MATHPHAPDPATLQTTPARTATPQGVIASFRASRVERLLTLLDCLVLEHPAACARPIEQIQGGLAPTDPSTTHSFLTQRSQPHTLDAQIRACAGKCVLLFVRNPRAVTIDNYRRERATPRPFGGTLDDFLCATDKESSPESRLGLRACLSFMSAFARAQQSFDALLVIHAEDLESSPWETTRAAAAFLSIHADEAQWIRAIRRAGPLTASPIHPPTHNHPDPLALTFPAPDPFTSTSHQPAPSLSTSTVALSLSTGQQVFANHTISEHLHPMFNRYRKSKATPTAHPLSQAA